MFSPHRFFPIQDVDEEKQRQTELIQDYLDHLCTPLVGILPYARRQEVRLEAEGHLYALIEEQREAGLNLLRATEKALEHYGLPYRLGQEIAAGWCAGEGSRTRPGQYMRMATLRAFACFSTPAAVSLLLVENYALSGSGMEIPAWILIWLFLSPLLAGAFCGWILPIRSAQAVCYANFLLLLYGIVIGLTLLPLRDGLNLALFQLVYGLPTGVLTASFIEVVHRYLIKTRFRPVATH